MRKSALLTIGTLLLAACDARETDRTAAAPASRRTPASSPTPADSIIPESIRALFDASGKTLEEAQNASQEELRKLARFEYRVISVPSVSGDEALEQNLNALGKDGWECSPLGTADESLRFVCKKHPYTPLRFIPGTLLGR